MNNKLRNVLKKRYEAEIEDAKYKIQSFNENNIIIPEHIDITGEVDKLLLKIAEAEDKLAVMRLHYDQKEAKSTEYKKAIQFLATDDSCYMTGQSLIMDGGRTIW